MTLDDLIASGPNKIQGEAKSVSKAMKCFDFVFCLHLMFEVMKITDFLCQSLQQKAIDIINALNFLSITKSKLQEMRADGWAGLIKTVESFCHEHNIDMPDMFDRYMEGTSRSCQQRDFITNEHYYRVNILNVVIDFQLAELESRFPDQSLELLFLSATFDPRDNFQLFESENVCNLAMKFYPEDFTPGEMHACSRNGVWIFTSRYQEGYKI
jgi:hypothetical protein